MVKYNHLLALSKGLGLRRAPAEGVEHVEEGDGDVDEDDEGVEGVGDQLVRPLGVTGGRGRARLLLHKFSWKAVLLESSW